MTKLHENTYILPSSLSLTMKLGVSVTLVIQREDWRQSLANKNGREKYHTTLIT